MKIIKLKTMKIALPLAYRWTKDSVTRRMRFGSFLIRLAAY